MARRVRGLIVINCRRQMPGQIDFWTFHPTAGSDLPASSGAQWSGKNTSPLPRLRPSPSLSVFRGLAVRLVSYRVTIFLNSRANSFLIFKNRISTEIVMRRRRKQLYVRFQDLRPSVIFFAKFAFVPIVPNSIRDGRLQFNAWNKKRLC